MNFIWNQVKSQVSLSVFAIFLGIFFRFFELGYSDLQGDEITSFGFLKNTSSGAPSIGNFTSFLFQQRKGPIQFIINYINIGLFGYRSEFQIRLVFSIFSIFSVLLTYFLAKKIFDKKVSLFSAILISLCGLFISFGRISQYQSVIQFLLPLSLVLFLAGIERNSFWKIFLSSIFLSFAILSHYDSLSAISFFVIYFFQRYQSPDFDKNDLKRSMKIFLIPFIIIAGSFYLPYLFSGQYKSDTSSYLENRIVGSSMFSDFDSVLNLLTFYVPTFVLIFLFFLITVGLFIFGRSIEAQNRFFRKKISLQKVYNTSLGIFTASIILNVLISSKIFNIIGIISSISIYLTLLFSRNSDIAKSSLIGWFVATFSFYFLFISDPRTHIYISFIPGFIIASYGFVQIIGFKRIKKFALVSVTMVFFVQSIFNYFVFVDKESEYPWGRKSIFGFELKNKEGDEKIHGLFGFNHYRHWEEIGEIFENGDLEGDYFSNEKNNITNFYIGKDQSAIEEAEIIIWIYHPHSMEILNRDELKYFSKYKEFRNKDQLVSEIWIRN